jgi:hypothetical protein
MLPEVRSIFISIRKLLNSTLNPDFRATIDHTATLECYHNSRRGYLAVLVCKVHQEDSR